jgi:hypothetical protein
MKCTACGNENQPTAKFCVHCGVLLTPMPASVAAPSVGASTTSMPAAAPAAPRPVPPAPPPPPPPPQSFAPEPAPVPAAPMSATPMPATPMPAAPAPDLAPAPPASNRNALIIGAVAVVIVIAVGFLGYRALYGGNKQPSMTTAETPKAAQQSATNPSPSEPVKDAAPVAAAPAEPSALPPAVEEPAKTAAAEPAPLPGTPAAAPKPRATQPKPGPKIEPTAEPAPAPSPAKTPTKATAVAAATQSASQPDHWQMYADAQARCAREDFFKRLACELRTRNQYCQGYWGQVPQCPEAMPRERGQ